MPYSENKSYQPDLALAHPAYDWRGKLIVRSNSENVCYRNQDVLASFTVMRDKPHDVRLMETIPQNDPRSLGISVSLEADDDKHAFTKMSGLALLVMRKAEIDIRDLYLEVGFLASQAELTSHDPTDAGSRLASGRYMVGGPLSYIFDELQDHMYTYGLPTTY